MGALLRRLSRQHAWQVFAAALILSLLSAPLRASPTHPLLFLLSSALGAVLMFVYPILIIFGFPPPYSTPLRRRIAFISAGLLCAVIFSAALLPTAHLGLPDWLRVSLQLPLTVILLAPFFIATGVVDDARRALGQYRLGDCIGTWLCIFSYPLVGVFFLQNRVAAVLVALDAKGLPAHGRTSAV
jgi:hypothetical protein